MWQIELKFYLCTSSGEQDILNEKTELEATLKEAELATCSVELFLPLFKDTVEEISFENVSTWLMNI